MAPLPSNEVWYNVKTYGAVGNGTTDDTAAVQSTIAYHCLLVRSKIILKGASRDASIIKLANNQPQDCRIIANYNQQSGGDESIAFEDFTIDGNANNQGTVTAMVGISCVRTQHVRHNRLSIKNIKGVLPVNTQPSGEGVHFDSYSSSHNSYTDCEATQTVVGSNIGGTGFSATNCTGIEYKGCLAYKLSGWTGFTIHKSRHVQYVNCHSFLNN